MARATAVRPQDDWNAKGIARAVYFTASIFANRRYHTFAADTREEAEEVARKMTAMAQNGRKAMVYAVTPEDFTIYVSTP